MNNICIINGSNKLRDDNYLLSNIWGKPLFSYIIETVIKSNQFKKIYFVCSNKQIAKTIKNKYSKVLVVKEFKKNIENNIIVEVSAFAPFIKEKTIKTVCELARNDNVIFYEEKIVNNLRNNSIITKKRNVITDAICGRNTRNEKTKKIKLSEKEALIVDNIIIFEASLNILKKENNKKILEEQIDKQIKEKEKVLKNVTNNKGIVLIGHSQFDQWKINKIGNNAVRNCGISGINSFQYKEKILDKNLLNYNGKAFIVIGGTNDIVYDYSINEIVDCIDLIIENIKINSNNKPIYFIECCHVNGRIDRSNKTIDRLNEALKNRLGKKVILISLKKMDDEFNQLKIEYTIDGLHFSKNGYRKLESIVNKKIKL